VRLFLAVEIDATVIDAAQTVTAQLRERAEAMAPQARITWIPASLMHLTVRFIGNVADGEVARLIEGLSAPLPIRPFSLEVLGLGAFPQRGAPRVLWAGIAGGTDELVRTEVETSARLQQLGVAPDDRIFSPHLTLARVREPAGLKASPLLAGLETTPLGTSRVDAITLFESRLSPKGPTYVALHRTALSRV
jgi:RNA 2',3'-cyclic 3'-phosphodiesterase